jgi:hypothetical protein
MTSAKVITPLVALHQMLSYNMLYLINVILYYIIL